MHLINKVLHKYFNSFNYFYKKLGYRVFVAIVLSILVGFLDGIGLAMFLPLLHMVDKGSNVDPESMGSLRFLLDIIYSLNIPLSLITVLAFLCIFFTLKGIAKYLSMVYQVIIRSIFLKRIRIDLLKGFNKLAFKYYIMADVGRIQNTMTGEADRVFRAISFYFRALEQMILVFVYIAFAYFVDARFALLVTAGGIITNFLFKIIYNYTKKSSKNLSVTTNQYQGLIIQHVSNFKYLKATATIPSFSKKLETSVNKIEHDNRKIGKLTGLVQSIREPILIYVVAAVILLQVTIFEASLAPILMSLLFFYRALSALMTMQSSYNSFLSVSGSMENVAEIQEEFEVNREINGKKNFTKFNSKLKLENIHFKYGNAVILPHLTLEIYKNQTIAFVGESGSGKTTLVNIIAGLVPLNGGNFLIDNISRDEIDMISYQKRIGYITQEPVIFNDTIFNNVTFWASPTNENVNKFREALRKASIEEFVFSLPEKEETLLGNNGVNISGGQKQRISIARELYKDIDILIMDEATSALDSETERVIQKSIDDLKGKYTILIVAHRLSTIKNADNIVVMKNGDIESIGSYDYLLQEDINFMRMVEMQEV